MKTPIDDLSTPVVHPGLKTKLLIDLCAQVAGIALVIFLMATSQDDYLSAFMTFYFGIGSYQFISSLVQLYFQKKTHALYRIYYIQLCIHLVFFLSAFTPAGLIGLFALLYLSPVTALYYFIVTIVTYNETRAYAKQ